jgi:predicted dinucleotide-binding enzyme
MDRDRLATPAGTSSAEEVQQLVPEGTCREGVQHDVAPTLVEGEVAGLQLDFLIAGDDE